MINLPYELLWGVDVAIKKLRPNARFEIQGSVITSYQSDDGLPPPEWHEIHDLMEQDRKAAEAWLASNMPAEPPEVVAIEDRNHEESNPGDTTPDLPAAVPIP